MTGGTVVLIWCIATHLSPAEKGGAFLWKKYEPAVGLFTSTRSMLIIGYGWLVLLSVDRMLIVGYG
jgi:hypothetical protein